jgi:hypothetical protein
LLIGANCCIFKSFCTALPPLDLSKMALIVHKYGGTSMGSVERIKNVAKRVAKWHRAGHQIVAGYGQRDFGPTRPA